MLNFVVYLLWHIVGKVACTNVLPEASPVGRRLVQAIINHLKSKSNSNIAPPLFTPSDFNDHFTSVAARIASSIPSSLLSPTSFISSSCDHIFEITEVDQSLINKLIDDLDPKKAVGFLPAY